jgi:hypothetical protein
MNINIIPRDSLLQQWVKLLSTTEIPLSFQITSGLSLIGCLLKRNVFIDQHSTGNWGWNVWPNQSIMYVGPSGCGKDSVINFVVRQLNEINETPVLGGKTIEAITTKLANLGKPAACFIPIPEMAAFFGSKDYQSGLIQEFTDLLSSNDSKEITTKSDMFNGINSKIIREPTITMHTGTTENWLHGLMPDGTLEGGFLGRFLIVVEDFGNKHVPLAKWEPRTKEERLELEDAARQWEGALREIITRCRNLGEIVLLEEAQQGYANWYHNRLRLFSKAVLPYANRSRDTVLRLAMLMGISRGHFGWIDKVDMDFGIDLISWVAKGIDSAVIPPTLEAQAAAKMMKLLPASSQEVIASLSRQYPLKILKQAEELLLMRGDIERKGNKWAKIERV